ncbi:MAG: HDOD domain-containing protein [Spirochaetota bacterium]
MTLIDDKNYPEKILKGEAVNFSFKFVDESSLVTINTVLLKVLSRMGNIFLLETIITIVREIIYNAFKANLKRIYFLGKGIDINDSKTYENGMDSFKEDFLYNLDAVSQIIHESSYSITVTFSLKGDLLEIRVYNNVSIIEEEVKRINLRIKKAEEYESLADAYDEVYDSTEGAGLGLVLMIFLLKNSGIGTSNLSFNTDKKGVAVSIGIPKEVKEKRIVTEVTKRILKDVGSLPTFPENIVTLQRMCSSTDTTLEEIAENIAKDPSLTADVLKLSNSAGFITGKRITTIKEAVKIIGFRNLNLILTASAARKILSDRYKKFEAIWDHSARVAFYARLIARKKNLTAVAESVFISGLLHDIGKIILLSMDSSIVNTISEITKDKQLRSSSILEEISIGISHAEIGGLIAEKWNFPESLFMAIKNHHSPMNSEKNHRDATYTTYLANLLCGVETRKYSYYYIESEVLKWAGLLTIEDVKEFHNNLQESYLKHISIAG